MIKTLQHKRAETRQIGAVLRDPEFVKLAGTTWEMAVNGDGAMLKNCRLQVVQHCDGLAH